MRYLSAFLLAMSVMFVCMHTASAQSDFDISVEWVKTPKPLLKKNSKTYSAAEDADPDVEGMWSVELTDRTLFNTISRWSREAQWQLVWEADRDFPIEAQVLFQGSFQSAISLVMKSLSDTDYPLQAVVNSDARIIRIVRYMQSKNN